MKEQLREIILEAGWRFPVTIYTYPDGETKPHWEMDFYSNDPNCEEIYQVIEAIMKGYTDH